MPEVIDRTQAIRIFNDKNFDSLSRVLMVTNVPKWAEGKREFFNETPEIQAADIAQTESNQPVRFFAKSQGTDCKNELETRIRNATRLVMIGMGLNVLNSRELVHSLADRVAAGKCTAEIYLGDVDSPALRHG
jgi:hypothetical protein